MTFVFLISAYIDYFRASEGALKSKLSTLFLNKKQDARKLKTDLQKEN